LEHTTIADMFRSRVSQSGDRVALRYKAEGVWRTISWNEWAARSKKVALGLIALGVEPGDRVAILSSTRPEWAISDIAILLAGATTVPIYPSNLADQCEYILNNSETKVLFVEDAAQLAKIEKVRANLKSLRKIVLFSGEPPAADHLLFISLEALIALGEKNAAEGELGRRTEAIKSDTAATFVYTSGTTGPPKGVVLSHDNFCFECSAIGQLVRITEDDEQLLFLPLAHIFAKILYIAAIQTGSTIAFAESIEKVVQNLGEIRPTFVGSVPRIYEKVYAKVTSGAQQAGGLKLKIFNWAIKVGRASSAERQKGRSGASLRYRIAQKLVFSKLKALFGGRLRFFVSGGAPLSKEIAEFFHAADILILEGYGLTETTAATHVNLPGKYKFGTVGPALPGVETQIAPDGEILLRGRNVMKGYYKLPDDSREAIDAQGWFHTGDIGEVDAEGFLRITDRKKDIIVTAGGKNIAPQNIENLLKTDPLISQAMVYGDKKPYCVALVTLNEESLKKWAQDHGVRNGQYSEMTQLPEVKSEVDKVIARMNQKLASYESIKKFAILPHDFTQETGELTPTLKIKRKFATQKFWKTIAEMYGE
jgi:long-chain acyl-CoA synthetase